MKTRPFLFGCLLLLAACNPPDREAPKLLRQAESVLETYPDSALRLIDSVMHEEIYFTEAQRMEMALLQGRAIYGDDRDATDYNNERGNFAWANMLSHIYTSPDLDRAPDYFAQKHQPQKAALAALYKGYDLQEVFSDSLALQSFREAADYGLEANDSLTTARACFQMGRLLYQKGQYEEAIDVLSSACCYFGQRIYELSLVLNMLSVNYSLSSAFDNALTCSMQSVELAKQSGNADAIWRAMFNYGVLLGGKHFDNRDAGIEILKQLEVDTTGMKLAHQAYAIKELYMKHNLWHDIRPISNDTTDYYMDVWRKAISSNSYDEYHIFSSKLYKSYGRQHDLYPVYTKPWEKSTDGGSFYAMKYTLRQQQRDAYMSLRNTLDAKKMHEQHKALVFCTVAIAALLLIIGILLYWLKRKPKAEEPVAEKEEETEPQTEVVSVETKIEAVPAEAKPQVTETNPFVSQEIAKRLRLILSAARAEKKANDPMKEWTPLVRQVMNNKETAYEAAASVIEEAYPGLQAKISELYPDLNETDSKVCLLSCSDINNTEMGELLDLSVHSIYKSRSELRKKLGFELGS
jgi:tetratricopeptide (TPR) repeat protein